MAREVLGIAGAVIGAYYGGPQGAKIGFMIGSSVGALIDGPETIKGPQLSDAPAQTSRPGGVIPMGWGIVHVRGNIIQTNPMYQIIVVESQGKGGGVKVKTPHRLQTFGIGICRSRLGPIAGIRRIWENDKLVYDTREFPAISIVETLAYAENIRIYLGTETQLPDPDFEAHTGVGDCPAYRGLSYIVWPDYDITEFGSAIPNYRFEVLINTVREVTSRVYPIEAFDQLAFGISSPSGSMSTIPEDQYDLTQAFQGMTMREALKTTDVGEDEYDLTQAFQGMVLRQILKTVDVGEDEYDLTQAYLGMTMRQALVRQTMVPEKLQLGISSPTGSMTPI